ncbi:MAG TPA: EI24 domain-containing protein [Bacteroidia bacterium]|jgi:CysZ protein
MLKQFLGAVRAYGQAFNIIIENRLWGYFFFPVLLFILLLIGGTAVIDSISDQLQGYVISWIGINKANSEVSAALHFIISIGLRIIFFFVYSAILKYLVLILLSPVLALLSERIDEIITGRKYTFNPLQLLKDALRGSLIAFRNMLIQFALIICCFGLMMVPLLGWLAPVFLAVINYYFYGFAMIDYTNERYKMSISGSIAFVKKNKGLAIGNGFIFALFFAIPFAGVIVAPILSVIAATIVAVEAHKDQNEVYAKN